MKTIAVGLVCFAVLVVTQAALNKERVLPLLQKCKEEIGADEDPIKIVNNVQIPESYKGKCMTACYLDKEGVVENGKLDSSKLNELVDQIYDEESAKAIKAAHGKCLPKTKETDKCEFASSYTKCLRKEGAILI